MASRKPVGMKSSKTANLKTVKKSATKAKEVSPKKQAAKNELKSAGKKVAGKKPVSKPTMKNKARSHKIQSTANHNNKAGHGHHSGPELGQEVPSFSLPSTNGADFDLSTYFGRPVVLYFYPRDATPGCTLEGHEFSRLKDDFAELGAEVFGISRDSMKSHERFKEKEGYSVELLSDKEEEACRLFDVIRMKSMYGKEVVGIERSTFLIDAQGRLAAEWRKVSVPGHAEAVLEKLKEIVSE